MRDDPREDEAVRVLVGLGWVLVHRQPSKTSASVYLTFARTDGAAFVLRISDHRCRRRWADGLPMFTWATKGLRRLRERLPAWLQRSQSLGRLTQGLAGGRGV